MIAFMLIVLVPAVLLFACIPFVMFGLMLETVAQRTPASPVREAFSHAGQTDFGVQEACPCSA